MKRTALIEARKRSGLSAVALAESAGSNEVRIFAFERGRYQPHRDEAMRISAALNTAPEILFPEMFKGPAVKP